MINIELFRDGLKSLNENEELGIYIHIPFCVSKCPYCDFYSIDESLYLKEDLISKYVDSVLKYIKAWSDLLSKNKNGVPTVDTIYLGGGTPSLLNETQVETLINCIKTNFIVTEDAEITMEMNPGDKNLKDLLKAFKDVGGNRVSIGMQSFDDNQLKLLGRRHGTRDVEKAVEAIKKAGISNFSVDIMLATENQTKEHIKKAIEKAAEFDAKHVSVYMLQVEEGTAFWENRENMSLPDDDQSSEHYLYACLQLEEKGFTQYEISNFSKEGYESRHNIKYWLYKPYLGIGPSAHSFIGGKRFFYDSYVNEFIKGTSPIMDEDEGIYKTGSIEEYFMLSLRLTKGVTEKDFHKMFGVCIPDKYREKAKKVPENLIVSDKKGIRLTREGFLLSNWVIIRLLDN